MQPRQLLLDCKGAGLLCNVRVAGAACAAGVRTIDNIMVIYLKARTRNRCKSLSNESFRQYPAKPSRRTKTPTAELLREICGQATAERS